MAAPPYMKLFWGDYHKATRHLRRDQHGAYFLLIGEAWRLGGALPDDDAKLAAWALCTPEEWSAMKPIVMDFFTLRRGKWWHDRVREELASYESTSRKRKEAGKKGGKASVGKDEANAEANASLLPPKPEPEPEPYTEPPVVPPRGTKSPKVSKDQVQAVWTACPVIARQRSSVADVEAALNAALRRGHQPEAVLAGLLAAYRSDTYAGDKAKGVHRLIDKDRWASFVETGAGAASSPAAAPTYDGPPDIRAWAVQHLTEGYAKAYVDPARWDATNRVLLAANPFAEGKLKRDLAPICARWKFTVRIAAANDPKPDLFAGGAAA